MQHPAWNLIVVGGLIVLVGVVWLFGPSLPWVGKLPGDIRVDRENFHFYFPLATCILLSILLSIVMWLVNYFSRR